jgi:hypothetical protein
MEGRHIQLGAVAPTCEVVVDAPEESDEDDSDSDGGSSLSFRCSLNSDLRRRC